MSRNGHRSCAVVSCGDPAMPSGRKCLDHYLAECAELDRAASEPEEQEVIEDEPWRTALAEALHSWVERALDGLNEEIERRVQERIERAVAEFQAEPSDDVAPHDPDDDRVCTRCGVWIPSATEPTCALP